MPLLFLILLTLLQPDWRAVNPNTADASPLAARGPLVPRDLRRPAGFDRVYQLFENGRPTDTFARRDGALTAVFPRSVYSQYQGRDLALVPPGTVYRIGVTANPFAFNAASSSAAPAAPNFIDRTAPAPMPSPRAFAPVSDRSIWTDDRLRASRVATLLDEAFSARQTYQQTFKQTTPPTAPSVIAPRPPQ